MGFRVSGLALNPIFTPFLLMTLGKQSASAPLFLISRMGQQAQCVALTRERLGRHTFAPRMALPFSKRRQVTDMLE